MAPTRRAPTRSLDDIFDTTPFLSNSTSPGDETIRSRRSSMRASSSRMMQEPLLLVQETAEEQLEETQSDWAYSKLIVVLYIIWNFPFVVVASAVLFLSRDESPAKPLRLWILGYALPFVIRIMYTCVDYRRRRRLTFPVASRGSSSGGEYSASEEEAWAQIKEELTRIYSIVKHVKLATTCTAFSFIWWMVGFYWVYAGGQALIRDSPQLYRLCIIFLAFDVFCVVLCVALVVCLALLLAAVSSLLLQLLKLWQIRSLPTEQADNFPPYFLKIFRVMEVMYKACMG